VYPTKYNLCEHKSLRWFEMEPEEEDGPGFNPRRTGGASAAAEQIGIAKSTPHAMIRTRARERSAKCNLAKSICFTLCNICTAGMLAACTSAVQALPLSTTSFDQLASRCAPGVKLSTLRAVASVESHFEPWTVRDNSTHESWTLASPAAALVLAGDRLRKSHSVDLGLMQINSGNLVALGMGMNDAFDPCRSLGAASRILLAGFAAGSSEAERQAAILIALSRYNTGRPLAGIANGYVDRVIAAQSKSPDGQLVRQGASNTPPQWDIWGVSGTAQSAWVLTANGSSEIERAGAQTSDARNEGRAPASPSEKGEPYELSAYQESEANKP
jgi:type IV secretion system protein VirB1